MIHSKVRTCSRPNIARIIASSFRTKVDCVFFVYVINFDIHLKQNFFNHCNTFVRCPYCPKAVKKEPFFAIFSKAYLFVLVNIPNQWCFSNKKKNNNTQIKLIEKHWPLLRWLQYSLNPCFVIMPLMSSVQFVPLNSPL